MSIPIDTTIIPFPYNICKDRGEGVLFDYSVLGDTIRELRKEKGLSQGVLSGLAGIARTHLTMIENETMKATVDTICKIAHALDLQPSELFALAEKNQA